MNILIYAPGISKGWGGVYQYTISLLRNLTTNCPDLVLFIYLEGCDPDFEEAVRQLSSVHIVKTNDSLFFRGWSKFRRLINNMIFRIVKIKLFTLYSPLDLYIKRSKIDIIHCPYPSIYKMGGIPVLTTVHDVQELHFPQFFSSAERASRALGHKNAIDKAQAVVVSYDHIKRDIEKYFEKPASDIIVCPLDLNELWFDSFVCDPGSSEDHQFFTDYILYPAATWEHKNHLRLLESLSLIKRKYAKTINLIVTGDLKKYFYDVLKDKIIEFGLENQVRFLGIVDEALLYKLYLGSTAVVIPTLYEAGSFPLIESILLNVPVICSNVTSLPETIGNGKFIFDPNDPNEISEKIISITEDMNFRMENINNSKIRAKQLRQDQFATIIHDLYLQLLAKGKASGSLRFDRMDEGQDKTVGR